MDRDSRIYVAGHTGLIGSAICRTLRQRGYDSLIVRRHDECDLSDRSAVEELFRTERPEYVFLLAAMAGGIHRNKSYPAEMIYVNLAVQTNVIDSAYCHGVKKLLFPGSACSYPRQCPMPINPAAMLTGPLEPTNEPFAIAKIAGMRMCKAYNEQYGTRFVSVIPATAYGPGDHFDENGHVLAALMARFHSAKTDGAPQVTVWGTGKPRREFIYVDDVAAAMTLVMDEYNGDDVVNIGVGQDMSISDLAERIAQVVGFEGRILFDTTQPDGMPQRLLNSRQIADMGWRAQTPLDKGLAATYAWYLDNVVAAR